MRGKQRQRGRTVSDTTQGRYRWGGRSSHGHMYLVIGGASPRRVPLESAVVRFCPRPQFYQSVSSGLPVCRLLRCIWHQRGQPTTTNRSGFRDQHTQRGMLTDHGGQSSARGPSSGATRGGRSTVVVLFCTLHSALPAGCRRGSRQSCEWSYGMQNMKVDRSAAHTRKTQCKIHLYLKRQLLIAVAQKDSCD